MGDPDWKMVLAAGRNVADERLPGTVYLCVRFDDVCAGELCRRLVVRSEGFSEGLSSCTDFHGHDGGLLYPDLSIHVSNLCDGIPSERSGGVGAEPGKLENLSCIRIMSGSGAGIVPVKYRLRLCAGAGFPDPPAAGWGRDKEGFRISWQNRFVVSVLLYHL